MKGLFLLNIFFRIKLNNEAEAILSVTYKELLFICTSSLINPVMNNVAGAARQTGLLYFEMNLKKLFCPGVLVSAMLRKMR